MNRFSLLIVKHPLIDDLFVKRFDKPHQQTMVSCIIHYLDRCVALELVLILQKIDVSFNLFFILFTNWISSNQLCKGEIFTDNTRSLKQKHQFCTIF